MTLSHLSQSLVRLEGTAVCFAESCWPGKSIGGKVLKGKFWGGQQQPAAASGRQRR